MSENFDELLEKSLKTIRTGEIVEGTVIGVKEDEIILGQSNSNSSIQRER